MIRKNDIVQVITGEEKGKKGKVLNVDLSSNRVLVEGVNFIWKHLRRSQQHPHGARIQKEASIHVSNVKVECQSCNKLTRVISKKVEDGRARICKKCGQSVANFKLRKGQNIGLKVTLRGPRMYEFLDRLISVVIPRIRDFRGLSPRAFDQAGNYNLGISEQIVFPEINIEKMEFTQGMNITIGVKARRSTDSLELLKRLGVPFRQP